MGRGVESFCRIKEGGGGRSFKGNFEGSEGRFKS